MLLSIPDIMPQRRSSSYSSGILIIITMTLSSILASPTTASTCIRQYLPPNVRYPPYPLKPANSTSTLNLPTIQSWTPPQPQDLYGTYFITYSSRPSYQTLTNLRGEHYPVFPQTTPSSPPGSEVDIVSWSTSPTDLSSKTITTVFGYFKPLTLTNNTSNPSATYSYSSTGILANTTNLYSILGFGLDPLGVPYRIDYETGYYASGASLTNAQPCINLASRSEDGPADATVAEIVTALKVLGRRYGDDGFVGLVDGLKKLRVDGRREGEGPVVCDAACMANKDLMPV